MLTLPRSAVRQFLQVLRKAGLLKSTRSRPTPYARLTADGRQLTCQALDHELSVAWTTPHTSQPETLVVPLALLADASQRTEGDVTFDVSNGRLCSAWTDRGMPVERDDDALNANDANDVPPIPALPTVWSEHPATLLSALRDAMDTTDPDSQRYALGCVQLSGADGGIAATDSRQALIQSGFPFPWQDAVLIPSRKVFRAEVFSHDLSVRIGRTDQQVVLQAGGWTLAFTIRTEGRFPDVQRIMPAESAVRTRLQLHPDDVRFAAERLAQLPQAPELHRGVTLDLNGAVAIRARRSAEATATELVLRRSQRVGDEIRLATDRKFLQRALDLGFTEMGFISDESPIVCRDATRQYVWAVLAPDSAVPASDSTHRVDSLDAKPGRSRITRHLAAADVGRRMVRPVPQTTSPLTPAASRRTNTRSCSMPQTNGSVPSHHDLIAQLLDLRKQLRAIEQAVVTVARQLQARRKQQQLMKTTLASLKQLQTLEV